MNVSQMMGNVQRGDQPQQMMENVPQGDQPQQIQSTTGPSGTQQRQQTVSLNILFILFHKLQMLNDSITHEK